MREAENMKIKEGFLRKKDDRIEMAFWIDKNEDEEESHMRQRRMHSCSQLRLCTNTDSGRMRA
jgi:hypothetical protein